MTTALSPWSIRAVNLAEHADNPVHTREGGRAAGYAGAVVAGTTIYAYLTHPVVAARGLGWLGNGTAEVRFRAPVLEDELVELRPVDNGDETVVEAHNTSGLCATLRVDIDHAPPADPAGDRLDPLVVEIDERWAGYARRAGDDLPLYAEEGVVHPVVWPSLANRVFSTQLVEGAWVHTRSLIRHLDLARPGDVVVVEAWLLERFATRAGERAVVDVRMSIDDRPVAAIEHEAIVRLADDRGATT